MKIMNDISARHEKYQQITIIAPCPKALSQVNIFNCTHRKDFHFKFAERFNVKQDLVCKIAYVSDE